MDDLLRLVTGMTELVDKFKLDACAIGDVLVRKSSHVFEVPKSNLDDLDRPFSEYDED